MNNMILQTWRLFGWIAILLHNKRQDFQKKIINN